MVIRRRACALLSAAFMLAGGHLYAQSADQARTTAEERKEAQAIEALVNSAKPLANDLSLAWLGSDALRSQNNKAYVPFTVTVDPTTVTTGRVTVYWRVGSADNPLVPTAPPAKGKRGNRETGADLVPEDLSIVQLEPGQEGPLRISRAVAVGPGTYEVAVIVKETAPVGKKMDRPARVGFIRQALTVPDLWRGELSTSSVIVGSRIDPLPAPLTPAQQFERPYAIGNIEIIPAGTTRFSKRDELSVFMMIYDAKVDASNAPDVIVEFSFYNVANGSEKYFNRTNPQVWNRRQRRDSILPWGCRMARPFRSGRFPRGTTGWK